MPRELAKMAATDDLFTATGIKSRFDTFTDQVWKSPLFATNGQQVQNDAMSDMHREEAKARIEASEARVAAVVESMRADAAELRSEVHAGLEQIKAQGVVAQANADTFYADARTILADSKTLLAEIRQAGEKNRADVMGMGYKILTWIFGALLALCGLYFTIKKAVQQPPAPQSPVAAPASYNPPSAASVPPQAPASVPPPTKP